MSYDLYLRKKKGGKISADEFKNYFLQKENYKVEGSQVVYENDDTGAYFILDYNNLQEVSDKTNTPADLSEITLSLNYVRPHFFGLEAEPQVKNLVKELDLQIYDPQDNGNPSNDYDTDAFINGWNTGNKFSYQEISKSNPEVKNLVLPSADIEKYWHWNLQRKTLQSKLGHNIFVPKIGFHQYNNKLCSTIIWSEAIPTAFPEVDTVIIFRKFLAPVRFFLKKKDDFTITEFSKIKPLLTDVQSNSDYSFRLLRSLDKAKSWVVSLPRSKHTPSIISNDKILDKEIFG